MIFADGIEKTKYAEKKAVCISMLASIFILKTCCAYGMRTSFRDVSEPHMKNNAVTTVSGPLYKAEEEEEAFAGIGDAFGVAVGMKSRPPFNRVHFSISLGIIALARLDNAHRDRQFVLRGLSRSKKQRRQGRPPAVFDKSEFWLMPLLLVDCFLQFGPRGELRDSTGSDLDSGPRLWVTPVPCLSLRHRECAETYQGHPISFSEGGGYAVHSGIDCGGGLRLADFTSACDLVHEIGFVHESLLAGLYIPSTHREAEAVAELGNLS
jgi:hypothetical protein